MNEDIEMIYFRWVLSGQSVIRNSKGSNLKTQILYKLYFPVKMLVKKLVISVSPLLEQRLSIEDHQSKVISKVGGENETF